MDLDTIDSSIVREKIAELEKRIYEQGRLILLLKRMISGEADYVFDGEENPIERNPLGPQKKARTRKSDNRTVA